MHLAITHDTRYDYAQAVHHAQHIAYLQPRPTVCQQVVAHQLHVNPHPEQVAHSQDGYGNARQYLALHRAHTQLRVVARSQVNTRLPLPLHSQLAWETARAQLAWHAGTPWDPAAEFVLPSPHAPWHADFAAFAQPCFTPGVPLLQGVRALMRHLQSELRYDSQSTEVHTPALQALAQRKGVCQDFAHIMVASLRALGLAARYVSGYLLTQAPPGQPALLGSDASHAWVSVYLPDLPTAEAHTRWWDFDPTNQRDGCGTPGDDYVTVAWGRDYADVAPLRGVIQGGGVHTLQVAVTVTALHALG